MDAVHLLAPSSGIRNTVRVCLGHGCCASPGSQFWDQKRGWAVAFPSVSFSIPCHPCVWRAEEGTGDIPPALLAVKEVQGLRRLAWPWWDPTCHDLQTMENILCSLWPLQPRGNWLLWCGQSHGQCGHWLCALVSPWSTSQIGGPADGLLAGSCPGKGCASSQVLWFPIIYCIWQKKMQFESPSPWKSQILSWDFFLFLSQWLTSMYMMNLILCVHRVVLWFYSTASGWWVSRLLQAGAALTTSHCPLAISIQNSPFWEASLQQHLN